MIRNLTPVSAKELRNLPHECIIGSDVRRAMDWCEETFGERWSPPDNRCGRWTAFWDGFRSSNSKGYKFCFAEEQDMMVFMLVWS